MMPARRPNGGREPVARLAAMPRPPLFLLSVALGAVVAVALASCGSDDEGTIPPQSAAAMLTALENARGEQSQGDCTGVSDAAGNLLTAINEAPDTVDPDVRQAILDGANNLRALAEDENTCEPTGPTGPSGPQNDETTTEPTTTEPTTTETDTTTETEKPPPEQPGNEGGGNLGQGNQGGQPPGQSEDEPPGNGQGPPPDTGGTGGGGISP
jgi:hypothetical protein